jgi:hypothetical protein
LLVIPSIFDQSSEQEPFSRYNIFEIGYSSCGYNISWHDISESFEGIVSFWGKLLGHHQKKFGGTLCSLV